MRRFSLLPVFFVFLISCNQSGIGIFYSISREQPLKNTTLPDNLSISGMVKGESEYYVSGGGLYSRPITGGVEVEWDDAVATPSDGLSFCIRLLEFNDGLYGLFTNTSGNKTGIYSSGPKSIVWNEVVSFDKPIVAFAASETELFVTVREDDATYVTKTSTDGSDFSVSLSLPGQYTGVTDAADFASATWLVSGTKLYSDTGGTYEPVTGTNAPSSSKGFGGVYASAPAPDGLGRLFVSNAEGELYSTGDGLAWDVSPVTDANGNPVPLYDIEEVTVLDATVIVVGAKRGYYDVVFKGGYSFPFSLQQPGSTEAGTYSSSDANYLNIDLRTSVVRFFYVDRDSNTLFACTSGNGLWINPISGDTAGTLIRKWDRQ